MRLFPRARRRALRIVPLALLVAAPFSPFGPTAATAGPFTDGWTLDADASRLRFQSVKNETKVETSKFATFSGGIDEDGQASMRILLDSIDTEVDMRNVRMRFLFFETFRHPEATVTVDLTKVPLDDLPARRRLVVDLPYTLDLHGVSKEGMAEVAVTLLGDDLVSVASAETITIRTSDFDLDEGITKLEEAAGVEIIPSAGVTFDLTFARNAAGGQGEPTQVASVSPVTLPADPSRAALEPQGNFSNDACVGRFEVLSRAGNIYFASGSSQLDGRSGPLLASIVDIVNRCPGLRIEVGGHTDSDGSDLANQRLSERRARSVVSYLAREGVDPRRIVPRGYGEARPVLPNTNALNKRRNRRIEFSVARR